MIRWAKKLSRNFAAVGGYKAKTEPFSIEDAPSELFDLAVQAIETSGGKAKNNPKLEGEGANEWKYPLQGMIFSGAFSERQVIALDKKLEEYVTIVARSRAHSIAVNAICGNDTPPDKTPVMKGMCSQKYQPIEGIGSWR